jgi:hypothetical protein
MNPEKDWKALFVCPTNHGGVAVRSDTLEKEIAG